jgi:O-antigen/teichoic acid export membrane protein
VTSPGELAPARGPAANTAWAILAQLLGKIATLAWTVVATRVLPQDDFGAFAFALGLSTLMVAVVEWGFDSALLQRAAQTPGRASELFSQAVVWQLLVGPVVFTLTALATFSSRPSASAQVVLVLLLASMVFDNLSDSCRAVAAAVRDQRGVSIALTAQRWVTAALCIVAVAVDRSVVALAIAFFVSTAVGALLHVVAVRRTQVHFRLAAVSWAGLRSYLPGTGVLGINTVVLMVLFRLDAVLLGLLKDDHAVAVYAVSYRLLDTVLFVVQSLRQTLVPVMTGAARDAVRRTFDAGLAFSAFVYLPFAAVALVEAPRVIGLVFGSAYAEQSAGSLRWLAFAPLCYAAAVLATGVIQAAGRNSAFLATSVVATVVNIGLNLVLIPPYAGTGAGAATTIAFAVQAITALALLRRPGTLPHPVTVLLAAGVAALVLAGALVVMHLPLLVELVIGALVYVSVWAALISRSTLRDDVVALIRRRTP